MSLLTRDEVISQLQLAVSKGDRSADSIAALVCDAIDSGYWSEFNQEVSHKHVRHQSFQEFVTAPRWDGLGTTREALVGWIRPISSEAADRVEAAWRAEIPPAPQHGELGRGVDRGSGTTSNSGRTADGVLARLKRDDPGLADRVISGDLTPNAAAQLKGWRKHRVVLTNPESVTRQIAKHWDDELLADLINELTMLLHDKDNQ